MLLQACSTASSISTAMHRAPIQAMVFITKSVLPIRPISGETGVLGVAVCLDCTITLTIRHHLRTSLLYFTHLYLLLLNASLDLASYLPFVPGRVHRNVPLYNCTLLIKFISQFCFFGEVASNAVLLLL